MNMALFSLMASRALTLFIVVMVSVLTASSVLAEDFNAILQWHRTVSMGTPVSGIVVEVDAQIGKRVDEGHVLVRLSDKVFSSRVDALKAKLKSARNNRDESKREMERTQELYNRTLISDHELELAKIQRDDGEARYQEAIAVLTQAESDLQFSAIRAPFPAWVTQRNVEVGQTIISKLQAEPLVVLVEANRMVARAQISNSNISNLQIGHKAGVIIGETVYQGEVAQIAVSPSQGTTDEYAVDVLFEVAKKVYRAGQPAKVRFL